MICITAVEGHYQKLYGGEYLTQESLVIAFQDCCVVFTIVFIAAALASVCIPGGKAQKS